MNKIDFMVYVAIEHANPNGDPLAENRPRVNLDDYGYITDVCIKRKIRNALQDAGHEILIQSDDRIADGLNSIEARLKAEDALYEKNKPVEKNQFLEYACNKWIDVRAFGQVFALGKKAEGDGVSYGLRGAVNVQDAYSLSPIEIVSTQITKSTNGKEKEGGARSSDTMGMKHTVNFGIYKFSGSIMPLAAEKNGFTEDDVLAIKEAIANMFENDVSAARPSGSMWITRMYWVTHPSKFGAVPSAAIHHSVSAILNEDIVVSTKVSDYSFDDTKLMNMAKEHDIEVEKFVW